MSYYYNPQEAGGRMQDQDSELLFDQEEYYTLLRDDSLLARTGSNNFAALIEPSDPPTPQNGHSQQLQQPQPEVLQHHQQQHLGAVVTQVEVPREFVYQVSQNPDDNQLVALPWNMVDNADDMQDLQIPDGSGELIVPEALDQLQVGVVEGGPSTLVADSSSTTTLPPAQPPSLQPWPGRYNFTVSVPVDNRDRNKWCFSQMQRKLYLCPNVAVPVNVMVNQWTTNASIFITPVFKDSRFRLDPVRRCYNCKSGKATDPSLAEHLVQVEGEGCEYRLMNERHVVSVPLHPPPPGDMASTILVKLTCLTSCVGGPNRRLFSLVFTLRSNTTGEEIGRQILDVKCCKCPSRDMGHEDKNCAASQQANMRAGSDEEKLTKVQLLASTVSVGQKRKRPNIKLEPGTDTQYVIVKVPAEFESKVKSYINSLVAEREVKRHNRGVLPYPDVE